MVSAYFYGHAGYWDSAAQNWRYTDTDEPIAIPSARPCPQCYQLPTPEGHDACLGTIPGACAACCGHGVEMGYIAWDCGGSGSVKRVWFSVTLFGHTFEFAQITHVESDSGMAVTDPRVL